MIFLVVSFQALPSPFGVMAGESIRVAVEQDASSVQVRSASPLLIKDAGGKVVYPDRTGVVNVMPDGGGLWINGERIGADRVRIVSRRNDLQADGRSFRGLLEVRRHEEGLIVINELDLEDYLKGVVPKEMAHDWHPEALKVQAVVARTYALYQKRFNRGRVFDLVSTVQDQVYEGVDQEKAQSSLAVAMTDGLVVTYRGELALTLYHSTSAGRTQDIREVWDKDIPYLRGVSCPFDKDSPYYRWERSIPFQEVESALGGEFPQMGPMATFSPSMKTSQGRVREVRILHALGEIFLRGEDIRRVIGYRILPSTRFEVVGIGRDIRVVGRGYGHGIGLCQWGAKVQAEQGRSFPEILAYYYPGVEVVDYRTLPIGRGDRP